MVRRDYAEDPGRFLIHRIEGVHGHKWRLLLEVMQAVRSDVEMLEGSVRYLQLCLSARGLICTAKMVRALLAMVQGHGQEVQLILASV